MNTSFFITVALVFLFAAVVLILMILLSRTMKTFEIRRKETFEGRVLKQINALIILMTSTTMPDAAYRYHIKSIRKLSRNGSSAQIMIEQLVAIKKNFAGASALCAERLYFHTGLFQFSLKKLKSVFPHRQALGIRELTEFGYYMALPQIQRFLHDGNQNVREEALIAMLKMDKTNTLGFLDRYKRPITQMMTIRMHRELSQMPQRELPLFSRWFSSTNPDVVKFAVIMAGQFGQRSSTPHLHRLLHTNKTQVVAGAIESLAKLEAFETADAISGIAPGYWKNTRVSEMAAKSLGKLGHSDVHADTLRRYAGHPSYRVRFEALRSLLKTESQKNEFIREMTGHPINRGIIMHLTDRLLSD